MISFNKILREGQIDELSDEFKDDWHLFLKELLDDKGQAYVDKMLRTIQDNMNKGWFFKKPTKQRDNAILQFNKKFPEYIEHTRMMLESSVELYRGLTLKSYGDVVKVDSEWRKMTDGARITMQSYQGAHLFSWTQDLETAKEFTEFPVLILKARIPLDKIEWAGVTVRDVDDDVYAGIHNFEFIVNHKDGIEVEVDSSISEYGTDERGMYAIPRENPTQKGYFFYNPNAYYGQLTMFSVSEDLMKDRIEEDDNGLYYMMGSQKLYFIQEPTNEYMTDA